MSGVKEYRLVVMGSGGVEKNQLVMRFVAGRFIDQYDPTLVETYQKDCIIDGERAILDIIDTTGQEEYGNVCEQYMRTGEGFLLVYSITSRPSFEAISNIRHKILRVKDQDWFPIVVVANNCHLEHERQVGTNEGRDFAKYFGCPYVETSSKHGTNVNDAFCTLIREIRKYYKRNAEITSRLLRATSKALPVPPMSPPQTPWKRLLRRLLPCRNTK